MIKIFPGKGDKTKQQNVDSSKLAKRDGNKNIKDENVNPKNALDENKNTVEQNVMEDNKPKDKEKEIKKEITVKKVENKDSNKQSTQVKPKEDRPADSKIEKKEKQKLEKAEKNSEDSEMKRRSTSPPSLSSSYRLLPPIKKENEVFRREEIIKFYIKVLTFKEDRPVSSYDFHKDEDLESFCRLRLRHYSSRSLDLMLLEMRKLDRDRQTCVRCLTMF